MSDKKMEKEIPAEIPSENVEKEILKVESSKEKNIEAEVLEVIQEISEEKAEPENTPVTSEIKDTPKVEPEVTAEILSVEETPDTDEEEVTSSDNHEHEEIHEEEKDYHALSKQELITELGLLLKTKSVNEIKGPVEEIRSEFNSKFNEELGHAKEEFLEKGGNIIDFHFSTPLRKDFNSLYFDYKEKRNAYFKNLKKDLQANLSRRQELVAELKGLLNAEENINTTYKHFKDIQERWHTAGPIPRDKYNMVWNTYHHHVENFYDFLHLNREFRDLDFKHNLEQKLKLIVRAEELHQEEDVAKAFRELQMLHKVWKEEIGPVAKEYREDVWDQFSAATKVIHDKRQILLLELESAFENNYETKNELITAITEQTANTKPSHQSWQNSIKKIQGLRDTYFEIGKVPRSKNKEVWSAFKDATRTFNKEKNSFYKTQKKEQFNNLEKKRDLIKIAEENKESDDFDMVTPLMKKIQNDWKKIGHVPRKDSDKVWKIFKESCNFYFDRLHNQKNEANKEEMAHFESKSELLKEMNTLSLTGEQDADLKTVKDKINDWKEIGRVPYNKKTIEQKFNKTLDGLFKKMDLSKKDAELIKFENKLSTMVSHEDEQKLKNEHFFISKKIDESKNEIRQLENNLGFFQHVDESNPLVKEVHNNIARHKEQLEVWKGKLIRIKSARKG